MTINDLINKDEYKKFKLIGAEYSKAQDKTTLTFLYSSFDKPTDEEKQQLRDEVLKILGDISKNEVKFRKSYIDNDLVYTLLLDYTNTFPYLKGAIKKEDIHTSMTKDCAEIKVECDEEMKELLTNYKFLDEFKKIVQNHVFEDVKIELLVTKKSEEKVFFDDENEKMELKNILEEEQKINKVKVDEVVNLVGKNILSDAIFIKDVKKTDDEITLAGKFLNPVWSQFIPKSQKGKDGAKMKDKLSFVLKDASGEIEVVMFPQEKDKEKLERLTPEAEVIICGNYNDFMGRVNIKANALSVCKILTKEVKFLWREPIKEYKTVIPQKMEDLQQVNLFSMFDQKPNDYWQDGKSVVVFDFETTGLNADTCEIIEIGAVKVVNGVCTETFSTLVNPHQKLGREISELTGITDDMLVFAPDLEDVLPDFHKFVQNSVLSAYNIGFDIQFLLNAGKKFRYKFDNERIDTLELARQKIPSLPNYKLSSVVKALDIVLNDAHRAINDAVATAKVFIKLI